MSAPLADDVLDRVFRTARTANSYTDQPVGEGTLHALYDLLKRGPTSSNQQPLRIVWCMSAETKAKLAALCAEGNASKVRKAPVTAVLGMNMDFVKLLPRLFPYADARPWYVGNQALIEESAFRNFSLQGGYFIVAVRLLGPDSNPMSGFDSEK